ncbi:hypothetical protein V6N12_005882 [Hibiscus sabdariffa]|uniref:DUF4005 domain-containing protein n=1 Tax=Hibiscus sabdariffa TaxID=183260 RepID=A0ABR2EWD0_9ROSI
MNQTKQRAVLKTIAVSCRIIEVNQQMFPHEATRTRSYDEAIIYLYHTYKCPAEKTKEIAGESESFVCGTIFNAFILLLLFLLLHLQLLSSFLQACKLLGSSPAILPLRLQYGPEEPNSSWQWLQRWTKSHFWESTSKPITSGKTKRSVRKVSNAKVVNGSSHSNLEYEKNKRGLRRVSGNSASDLAREHPQNEPGRVKRNLRKLSDSSKEVADKSEAVNEKTKKPLKKASSSNNPDVSEQESAEKLRDVTATLSKLSNPEADLKFSSEDASLDEPIVCPAIDLSPAENNGKIECMSVTEELNSKDGQISDEGSKANQRRTSFPAKINNQSNGINNNPKVPSYMAPTESLKARLRGQGSPRFTQEVVEKNELNRRYSLPSSTNSNASSLPSRAQTRVRVAGKGAISNDKSQSSSKDANDKVVRAEWKR